MSKLLRHLFAPALGLALCLSGPASAAPSSYTQREQDWRNGAIVYQVIVDRFAPSARLHDKKHLYPAPKQLHPWEALAKRGTYLPQEKLWSHEIDFWGGDLASLGQRLPYIQGLGATVLYLNPVQQAYTNHKYDAQDMLRISPEYGTRDDLRALVRQTHAAGMKLVLDGVFNHMGRNAPIFQAAANDPQNPYRNWFVWGPQYPTGARIWWDAENLVELNLENPKVRDHMYQAPQSVLRSYLRDGVDGWRLDAATELGAPYLAALTRAAHQTKPGSLVVGEVVSYPGEWLKVMDGVMNFTLREIVLRLTRQEIPPAAAQQMVQRMVQDAGIEPLLKSWMVLDNHDIPRLATQLPNENQRRLAQVLQMTLPGSPNLYYGSELGMEGGEDPEMRSPMRWDWVTEHNPHLAWTRQLIALRQGQRALRVGDWRSLPAQKLFAFERHTDRVFDSVLVLANPSAEAVTETLMLPNASILMGTTMVDLLPLPATGTTATTGSTAATPAPLKTDSGILRVTVPAASVRVLQPRFTPLHGYTPYKRIP